MVPPPFGRGHHDFNPRSPYGERPHSQNAEIGTRKFQSTLPLRGATVKCGGSKTTNLFQSTLPLRGATRRPKYYNLFGGISIHAPLTGSDLRAEWQAVILSAFQSTLPLRGATRTTTITISASSDFNPRSPYGERRLSQLTSLIQSDFNPRSPYGERRDLGGIITCPQVISIHAPLTGSDARCLTLRQKLVISIHAPLTGSDSRGCPCFGGCHDFNPRSPYGERRAKSGEKIGGSQFQSTLPLRGATGCPRISSRRSVISIHAPLTGSDT